MKETKGKKRAKRTNQKEETQRERDRQEKKVFNLKSIEAGNMNLNWRQAKTNKIALMNFLINKTDFNNMNKDKLCSHRLLTLLPL